MSDAARAAATDRIRRIARALGEVNQRLVYIGASVLPLLVEVDHRLAVPGSTQDVDAVAATATYTASARLEESMRARGFRPQPGSHAGRYLSPAGELFDLSFAGSHTGGTGSAVDALAIATAVQLPGEPPIRHLSGAGFLIMKTAAFSDRGRSVPHDSKDLADIAVLLVGRPQLVSEVLGADAETRQAVGDASALLLAAHELAPALRGHFSKRSPVPPDTPADLAVETLRALEQLRDRSNRAI